MTNIYDSLDMFSQDEFSRGQIKGQVVWYSLNQAILRILHNKKMTLSKKRESLSV